MKKLNKKTLFFTFFLIAKNLLQASHHSIMLKQRTLDISASNIANLGTELEKKCRVEASNCEVSWKNAGKVPCVAFCPAKTNM